MDQVAYVDPESGEPVGVPSAPAPGRYVDPESGEPIMAKGANTATVESSPLQKFMKAAMTTKTGIAIPGVPGPFAAFTPLGGKSAEEIVDSLPGAAGAAAGFMTGGVGAMGAAAAGEAARQGIRRLTGLPQATGVTQNLLGLDPNSTEASLAGLAGEVGTAGLAAGAGKAIESGAGQALAVHKEVSHALSELGQISPALKAAFISAIPRNVMRGLGIATGGPKGLVIAEALTRLGSLPAARKFVFQAVNQAANGNVSQAARLLQAGASAYAAQLKKIEDESQQKLGPMVEGR